MKIVLATFGSRGDVQPMLALSLALKSKGHDVLLAAPPEKAAWAKQLGCPRLLFLISWINIIGAIRSIKSIQFKALLFQRPNPRYSFKIFIAMQQDDTMLYCDLGDATVYRAVDGDSLSP